MQQYNVLNTFTGMGQSEWGDKTEFQFQCQCNMNSTDFCCESAFWLHIYNTNLHTYTCREYTHTHTDTHEMHYIENCDRIAFPLYIWSAKDCAYTTYIICVFDADFNSRAHLPHLRNQCNGMCAQPHRLLPRYHAKLLTVHLHVQ